MTDDETIWPDPEDAQPDEGEPTQAQQDAEREATAEQLLAEESAKFARACQGRLRVFLAEHDRAMLVPATPEELQQGVVERVDGLAATLTENFTTFAGNLRKALELSLAVDYVEVAKAMVAHGNAIARPYVGDEQFVVLLAKPKAPGRVRAVPRRQAFEDPGAP